MKTLKMKLSLLPVIIIMIVGFTSCSDNSENSSAARVNIFLTDAPADYDAVYIDIQSIEIISDAGTHTYPLLNPGIYDLLQFNNGVDTLMISEDVSPRTVSQIRLILGDNNSVVVDGITYPLATPSAQTSGLKLNVHYTFEAGLVYNLWLDFDAEQSIVTTGGGGYSLKPVIRVYTEVESGGIAGNIFPFDAAYHVSAITPTDTFGTAISGDGSFLIGGLVAGTYSVQFSAVAGFSDITIPGVVVANGAITSTGEIIIPL